jgi:hypothetical protein
LDRGARQGNVVLSAELAAHCSAKLPREIEVEIVVTMGYRNGHELSAGCI